jgi:hypothetical protein
MILLQISELYNRSGALDGDIVVVCLNPETKWMVQTDQVNRIYMNLFLIES